MRKFPPGPFNYNAWCGLTWRHAYRQSTNPLAFSRYLAKTYGDLVFYRLFMYCAYQVNHPDLVREVLVTQGKKFHKQPRQMKILEQVTGQGLLNSEGPVWQRQRRILAGGFVGENSLALTRAALDEVSRLSWQNGQEIRLHDEMLRLTIAATAKALFGDTVHGRLDELARGMNAISAGIIDQVANILPLPSWLPFARVRARVEGIRAVSNYIKKIIADRRASGALGADMLSILLSAVDAEDGRGMSDAQAHSEAMTIFFAGHHTAAATLTWALYLLAKNPVHGERLLADVEKHVGARAIAASDARRFPCVEQTLNETMRVYPPAWSLFARVALADVELGGYTIPKGGWIYIFPWVLHHDPRSFPDPTRFDPDRFSSERIDQIPSGAFIPFGLGPHACAGTNMALQMLSCTLPALLKKYRFQLAPGQGEPEIEPLISLRPKDEIRMVVDARCSAFAQGRRHESLSDARD